MDNSPKTPGVYIQEIPAFPNNAAETAILSKIEEAIKQSLVPYALEPNDATTWASVMSMVGQYLNQLWMQGVLIGASASDAYSVAVGLGTTMTKEDILNGIMRVSAMVAITQPAEFSAVTVEQQMQAS